MVEEELEELPRFDPILRLPCVLFQVFLAPCVLLRLLLFFRFDIRLFDNRVHLFLGPISHFHEGVGFITDKSSYERYPCSTNCWATFSDMPFNFHEIDHRAFDLAFQFGRGHDFDVPTQSLLANRTFWPNRPMLEIDVLRRPRRSRGPIMSQRRTCSTSAGCSALGIRSMGSSLHRTISIRSPASSLVTFLIRCRACQTHAPTQSMRWSLLLTAICFDSRVRG